MYVMCSQFMSAKTEQILLAGPGVDLGFPEDEKQGANLYSANASQKLHEKKIVSKGGGGVLNFIMYITHNALAFLKLATV